MNDKSSSCSSQYEEPLKFDIAILHLVLQRNRNQHYRTSYYRRLDMVIRAITRYSILGDEREEDNFESENAENRVRETKNIDVYNTITGTTTLGFIEIISYLQQEYNRMISIVNRQKAKQRRYNKRRFNK